MSSITTKTVFSYLAVTMAIVFLAVTVNVSCGSYSQAHRGMETLLVDRNGPPVDAFALIYVEIIIQPGECISKSKECSEIIKQLPNITSRRTGSGLNMWHNGKEHIITAEHVCTEDIPKKFEHKGVAFTVTQTIKIEAHSTNGRVFKAKIAALDKDEDLCALKVDDHFSVPVKLAAQPPLLGSKVYSVAAPYGLAGTNLALTFTGYYSGKRSGRHYYTIPTRPGSSGAIVLNENFEAIGSLHTAYVPLENVGIGAGWQGLKMFLDAL